MKVSDLFDGPSQSVLFRVVYRAVRPGSWICIPGIGRVRCVSAGGGRHECVLGVRWVGLSLRDADYGGAVGRVVVLGSCLSGRVWWYTWMARTRVSISGSRLWSALDKVTWIDLGFEILEAGRRFRCQYMPAIAHVVQSLHNVYLTHDPVMIRDHIPMLVLLRCISNLFPPHYCPVRQRRKML